MATVQYNSKAYCSVFMWFIISGKEGYVFGLACLFASPLDN